LPIWDDFVAAGFCLPAEAVFAKGGRRAQLTRDDLLRAFHPAAASISPECSKTRILDDKIINGHELKM
jgi:hypothetical protein